MFDNNTLFFALHHILFIMVPRLVRALALLAEDGSSDTSDVNSQGHLLYERCVQASPKGLPSCMCQGHAFRPLFIIVNTLNIRLMSQASDSCR